VGKNISTQARAEAVAKAASGATDSLRAQGEHAVKAVRSAATVACDTAGHATDLLTDRAKQVKQASGPVRDAAQRAVEQSRHTAGTLTARGGHPASEGRPQWVARAAVAGACALGLGMLVWWLARTPEQEPAVLPVQPVPPA
jgi:cobalamin biosynthesis Mg chelatase CobN